MKLYEDLQIPQDATEAQIKAAYRKLVKKYHPDKNKGQSAALWQRIQDAYDVLSDPEKRKTYDATGDARRTSCERSEMEVNLISILMQFSDKFQAGEDFVQKMLSFLHDQKARERDQISSLRRDASKCLKIAARIERKSGSGPNVFREAMEDQAGKLKLAIENNEREIEDLQKMMDYLDDYESPQQSDVWGNHPETIAMISRLTFTP